VIDSIQHMRVAGLDLMEPDLQAEDEWVDHVQMVAYKTLFPQANSWYMGANIPGKPRLFMPYIAGVGSYRKTCEEIVASGFKGFRFERPAAMVAE
jgi:cyclohexanone monooxygenase